MVNERELRLKSLDLIWEDYMVKLMETELDIYLSRIQRMDTECQQYFNSSPLRNAFARVMNIARLKGQGCNITQLANQLLSSRQAVSTMIQECLERGWIELSIQQGREKNYVGTAELMKHMNHYIEFIYELDSKGLYPSHNLADKIFKLNPDYRYDSENRNTLDE